MTETHGKLEDRTYPMRNIFDDDDDDIDEGSEWTLGRRRPLRSRSVVSRTPTKRRQRRQKGQQKTVSESTNNEGDVATQGWRGRRLLKRILDIIFKMPTENSMDNMDLCLRC